MNELAAALIVGFAIGVPSGILLDRFTRLNVDLRAWYLRRPHGR